MWSKTLSRKILSVVVLAGFSFSLGFVFHAVLNGGGRGGLSWLTANVFVPHKQVQVNSEFPIRLAIPKIKVDAVIEQVGFASDWSMGVPKDPANVAWFNLGPRPGEIGSAVIAGHYGWRNGLPAAFDSLDKLVKGDKLYIEDEKGVAIIFMVREVRTYGQNEDASAVFTSSDGRAHLNLITCEGIWNKITRSYPKRLVIFTDLVI